MSVSWQVLVAAAAAVLLLVVSLGGSASAHGSGGSAAGEGDLEHPRHGLVELGFHGLGDFGQNTAMAAWTSSDDRLYAVGANAGDCPEMEAAFFGGADPSDPHEPGDLAGITMLDASDPSTPTTTATLRLGELSPAYAGNRVDGLDVAHVATESFDGELMAAATTGSCFSQQFVAGPLEGRILLLDVTDPSAPELLSDVQSSEAGYHQATLFERPDLGRVFVASMAWWHGGPTGLLGRVQLVDVTDPTAPVVAGQWGLDSDDGPGIDALCQARGDWPACHGVHLRVSDDGTRAYATFLDGGLVGLDISDPQAPTFIGHVQPGGTDNEGSTHGVDVYEAEGRQFAVIADEDFDGPLRPGVVIDSVDGDADVAVGERAAGVQPLGSLPLDPDAPVGPALALEVDPGTGCTFTQAGLTATAAGVDDWIGVFSQADQACMTTGEGARHAQEAGASGVIVVSPYEQVGLAPANFVWTDIPSVLVPAGLGQRLLDSISPTGSNVQVALEHVEIDDPYGFVRVVDITHDDAARWQQVSTFKAPHTQPGDTHPRGVFSAVETHVGNDGRIYVSWQTNGVRVLEPRGASGQLDEVAWFAPLASDHPDDNEQSEYGPHGMPGDLFHNPGFDDAVPAEHPTSGETVVFGLDTNRGLYILGYQQPTGTGDEPPASGRSEPVSAAAEPLPATGGGATSAAVLFASGAILLHSRKHI